MRKKFTVAGVRNAAPREKPYEVCDGDCKGLVLRVQPSGVKSYIARFSATKRRTIGDATVLTLEQARVTARAWMAEKDVGHLPPAARGDSRVPTLGEFIKADYAPWCTANKKAGEATIANLKAQFGNWYGRKLNDLDVGDFERFKTTRLNAGIKPPTVNRDLVRMSGVLTKALEWGKLRGPHPMAKVDDVEDASDLRVRYLTATEEKRLRAALVKREQTMRKARISGNAHAVARGREPRAVWTDDQYTDHLRPLVLLALNTGLRRGEMFSLDWGAIDLKQKRLTVTAKTAKSSRTRHVALNAEAVAVLTQWKKQGSGEGLVFPGEDGAKLTNINRSWRTLMKLAKLTNFRTHDVRHHFASTLAMRGVDLFTVGTLLGHGDTETTKRYAHLAPEHLASAVAKLGRPK